MKKIFFFLFILIFSSEIQLFAQNKISSSVLQSDNFERTFPQPYYDSITGELIHPPYTDPKTGVIYEFKDVYADRDPYMGEYLYCYDDKLETFGWSSDGKLYFAIHNYGYYEEELEMPTQYFLVDVATNTLLFYDTIQNKNLQKEHHIKLNSELKQFPLIITNDSGELLDKIDINNSLNNREGQQSLTFSSTKKGEILIKSSEEISDIDLGCPDEVKGYFLSPDEKYLVAVFYSNYRITGAGGDPCEGSIYFKVLDMKKFETIKKDKSFDEVITPFWDSYWNREHYEEKEIINTGLDSLITLLFPNADKDSLVNSIDSAIFSFFNEAKPTFNNADLKKLEKEKHVLYKELNDFLYYGFNEDSWKKPDPFETEGIGDAEDGVNFATNIFGWIKHLAEVSFGKEKEVYLNQLINYSIWRHVNEHDGYVDKLMALQELLQFQLQNHYNVEYTIESLKDFNTELLDLRTIFKNYIQGNQLNEWLYHYGDDKDIIYLKRLLDLCSSGEITSLRTNSNKFPGTDDYELTINEKSAVYTYDSYQITTVPHKETNGYVITIGNIEKESSFTIGEEWGLYFQGLIGHYMIIDEGTGTMRDLSVYDLQEQKMVFRNGYVGSLKVQEGKIHFLDQVQLQKESEKPECPQELIDLGYGIGYVEKLVYDIDKGKMKRTGEYQCWYFE